MSKSKSTPAPVGCDGTNKRCLLQSECGRKSCPYQNQERDCDYYRANARPGFEISGQESEDIDTTDGFILADAAAGHERGIEAITGEILEAKRVGGEAILTIGQRLIEAKELLPHGEWLSWLSEKVEFSERSARNFMRLAREWTNRQTLADLGASKALQLLALPDSEREEFLSETHQVNGQEKAVIDMTSQELKQAIKERDEAREAAERAQADSRAAQEARASMEQSLKSANDLLERAQAEKDQAAAAVADLEKQLADLKNAPVDVAVMDVDQEKLDKARAEGEAAKAAELADLQAKLDKAKESKKAADEKRREAESALADANAKLEQAAKEKAIAVAKSDPLVAKFEIFFNQAQEAANKMREFLLEARKREDLTTAQKLERAILAVGDAIKEKAK